MMGHMGDGMFGGGWGMGFGVLMMLAWVAFWALVVWLVVALLRRRPAKESASPALRILEERYARGEISHEEFQERREVLSRKGEPT